VGAYAILLAFSLLYALAGHSLLFKDVLTYLPSMPTGVLISIFILLVIGFGVKAAMMPLHPWAPSAYRESPHTFTSLFSGALSKMGIYGIFLTLFFFTFRFSTLGIGYLRGTHILGYILAWFGAVTAFLGALIAIKQDSAKKLLAYSSISQLGYVIFGLGIGTSMAVTGALFHAISHAIFKGLLFLAVAGVIKRIGTDNLTEMGGLIKRMPFTFVFALFGILALGSLHAYLREKERKKAVKFAVFLAISLGIVLLEVML
jgi:NADH-quinone oxidoreductase subunit M